jgi:hypothetical protein
VPAFAQRYPPFPIGGGGGTTGAGTTAPSTTSGSEFFNPGGSAGPNRDGSSSSDSSSSGSDEPACDLATCLRYAGQVRGEFVNAKVQERGTLFVASFEGCCEAFARVDVFMESERVFLGTVHAKEDGSYLGSFTLPSSIKAGRHNVVADIEGCGELKGAIEVVDAGVSVLGTSTRNTSGSSDASGSAVLPRTGSDFLRILVWALIFIAAGTLLIVVTRRFRPEAVPAGRTRGRGAVAALPPPEVPFVDTSRFVPYRSAPGQGLAGGGRRNRTTQARSRTDVGPASTTQRARTTSAWDRDRAPKNESPS